MKLRRVGPVPIVLVTAAFALAQARSSYRAQAAVIREAEERSLTGVATILAHATETEAQQATALAEMLAVRKSVQGHVRLGERDALQSDLTGIYERLHASYGIEGIQFNVPPGLVLLRMHAPEKHGDDVTGRQMVMLTLTGGESQSGVEVGSSGARIRGVVQIRDDVGAIGAVEVMVDYAPVLQATAGMTGFQLAAYLKQVGEPPAGARMVDGYRELGTTDRDAILAVVEAGSMDGVTDTLLTRRTVNGERYGVMRTPLVDFGGQTIGVLVATRSFAEYQSAENAAFRAALVWAIVQIVAVAGVVLLVFNGLLMRPVQRLTSRLAGGEGPDPALLERNDEVGELARAVAKATGEKP